MFQFSSNFYDTLFICWIYIHLLHLSFCHILSSLLVSNPVSYFACLNITELDCIFLCPKIPITGSITLLIKSNILTLLHSKSLLLFNYHNWLTFTPILPTKRQKDRIICKEISLFLSVFLHDCWLIMRNLCVCLVLVLFRKDKTNFCFVRIFFYAYFLLANCFF